MPSLTIRLRDEADEAAIKALRVATFETTASKAIMKAVREYPEFRRVPQASEAVNRDGSSVLWSCYFGLMADGTICEWAVTAYRLDVKPIADEGYGGCISGAGPAAPGKLRRCRSAWGLVLGGALGMARGQIATPGCSHEFGFGLRGENSGCRTR